MMERNRIIRAKIGPLTSSLCWGFAIVDMLLGIGFALLYHTTVPLAVANILTYRQWGIAFFVIGFVCVITLLRGASALVRCTQAASIVVYSIWLAALVIRSFVLPASVIITLVWAFFAYVQIMVFIHFDTTPVSGVEVKGGQ